MMLSLFLVIKLSLDLLKLFSKIKKTQDYGLTEQRLFTYSSHANYLGSMRLSSIERYCTKNTLFI